MRASARFAMTVLIAATAATACPSYSTFSRAMMLRVMCQKLTASRSGPTYANGWSGSSAPVITAFTPGSAAAREVSMDRIRACAWGLRSTFP